jgi:cyclic pyranopterin phosphate synthase
MGGPEQAPTGVPRQAGTASPPFLRAATALCYNAAVPTTGATTPLIVDRHGRRFRNLRVSLTSACNYACVYCVPDGKKLLKSADELTAEALVRAVRYLVDAAGIEQLRLTGGDPLVTPKFDSFLPAVMALGLRDVSLTTNGQLIERRFDTIRAAGLTRINISLDTLNPLGFRRLARGGDLETVLRGVDLCLRAGLRVKINMVPMRRQNLDQVLPMLEWCLDRGIELRYIELMRMGHLARSADFDADFIGMDELLERIGERYEFARTDAPHDATAVRFEVPGHGTFGIIPNESEPFCSACTRLRLSANGRLYGCLSDARSQDLRPLLELPRQEALPKLQAMLRRALDHKQPLAFKGEVTVMKFIGG